MQGKVYRNLSNKWVLKHNTQKQKTFFPLPTSTTETPRCFAGTRHPVGENGPASWHSRKSVTSLPLVPRIRFQYEHLQPASPTPVKRISLVKVEEKLQALTSWQKYLSLPPGWFTGGLGGWQLLKSVFFVGERSYSLRENTFFASSTVEKKKRKKITVISQVVRRRSSHLLTERASMKHSFYFPCRLYSSPSPPSPPPPPPDETLRVGVSSARGE